MTDFAKLAAAVKSKVGENDESATVKQWLTTGYPELDFAISGKYRGGGLPVGRIIEIYGPESSGKTAIATNAMATAQRMGGIAAFFDYENSFDMMLASSIGVEDGDQFIYKRPKTYEEGIVKFSDIVRAYREAGLPMEAPICAVFDSLASMIPKSQLEKGADEQTMADQLAPSRTTSATFKVIAAIAQEYNVCTIFLNQIRQKPGVMYGDPTTTPGGNAPKFYASVRIQLGASRIVSGKGDDKEMLGQEITARCIKNKTYRPFLMAKWRFLFRDDGTGYFDAAGSLVDFASRRGVLETAGPRVKWIDGKSYFKKEFAEKVERENLIEKLVDMLESHGVEPDVDATDTPSMGEES